MYKKIREIYYQFGTAIFKSLIKLKIIILPRLLLIMCLLTEIKIVILYRH